MNASDLIREFGIQHELFSSEDSETPSELDFEFEDGIQISVFSLNDDTVGVVHRIDLTGIPEVENISRVLLEQVWPVWRAGRCLLGVLPDGTAAVMREIDARTAERLAVAKALGEMLEAVHLLQARLTTIGVPPETDSRDWGALKA